METENQLPDVHDVWVEMKTAFDSDEKETQLLMRTLNANLKEVQKNLAVALDAGGWDAVIEQAHVLDGVASTLNWHELSRYAAALRTCAEKHDAPTIIRIGSKLDEVIQRTSEKEA